MLQIMGYHSTETVSFLSAGEEKDLSTSMHKNLEWCPFGKRWKGPLENCTILKLASTTLPLCSAMWSSGLEKEITLVGWTGLIQTARRKL